MTTTYKNHDILDAPAGGPIAHLSWKGTPDAFGNWYTVCGRIVPAYRASTLTDTDHDRVCVSCDKKATRRRGR